MEFPLSITATINSHEGDFSRDIELRSALTFIVGPNGSGKTHLLKGLKNSFQQYTTKKVRFISAGRLGVMEEYRSSYDGYDYGNDRIDQVTHGSKDYSTRRHNIETITGDLHTLSARPDILIKVRERLQKLFKRNINIDWDAGSLKVSFARLGNGNPFYSSGREASGLLHLVGILSALYDDEVGVLLIDEPEVSLHPQLQAFLLKEISRVAGIPSDENYQKIIVMATHSTEMIKLSKAADLLSFIFCNDLKEEPIHIPNDAGELKSEKIKSLVARLGQEHKLALFSKTPLLVEGPSDVIICNSLSDKLYLNLEAAGSQILPINGKGAMPETVKLFRLMGKTPTVLVDADAFADGLDLVLAYFGNEQIRDIADNLASEQGASGILDMTKSIHSDFCSLVQNNWEDIASVAQNHPYFTLSEDKSLNKKRSALCTIFSEQSFNGDWNRLRNRLCALFDIFEKTGLFILRKGAIESYYHDNNAITDKVDDAVTESEYISSADNLESSYQDILNCLEYASNSEIIDESRAIRDELLRFIAPIHARYAEGETNLDEFSRPSSIFNYRIDENKKLEISMSSKVLDVKGFPILLSKEDDVRKIVNSHLGLTKS
ncbi:AAA family ATPase [Glaesserella parasuis]|uniref:AAA family ATPase n=1 Tax=Glaesserella parasuis TaxID=738 RepID=A0AAJ6AEL5_GLAPU|nr:AAA family ATPase [Glaesserella parasuis]MCT8721665.1 AAA family ATPase [Glaesserella parasuis]MCT8727723.1 AAA family ATPase [Glaesserella parasuis]MCT8836227.1 AAA family ATPase [Glaesserella parasuis]MDG6310272.1 AAA family ATPase [Glaesserella parasuis]MDG6362056.1 AAA family ATPase [Glaesserella parasuis]